MENGFFSHIKRCTAWIFKYLLYQFNLILLACLGIKTAKLWISRPFDFSDTLEAFPQEPEFINKVYAEKQFWIALGLETLIFVIGGFLCYEVLIKQKTFRRGITAVLVIAFLWASGESLFLFMPATEKAHNINACRALNISWDAKNHKCRLMDLELRRFEKLNALKKKPVKSVKKTASKAKKQVSKKTTASSVAKKANVATKKNVPKKPVTKNKKASSPLPQTKTNTNTKPKTKATVKTNPDKK